MHPKMPTPSTRNKVFRANRYAGGDVVHYKARLVVQGFSQKPGIDYQVVPVKYLSSINAVLAIVGEGREFRIPEFRHTSTRDRTPLRTLQYYLILKSQVLQCRVDVVVTLLPRMVGPTVNGWCCRRGPSMIDIDKSFEVGHSSSSSDRGSEAFCRCSAFMAPTMSSESPF